MLAEIRNFGLCPCPRYLKHKSSRELIKSSGLNSSRCCGYQDENVDYLPDMKPSVHMILLQITFETVEKVQLLPFIEIRL